MHLQVIKSIGKVDVAVQLCLQHTKQFLHDSPTKKLRSKEKISDTTKAVDFKELFHSFIRGKHIKS